MHRLGRPHQAAPAALTAMMMPFTYSIANGLAFGFISYAPSRRSPAGLATSTRRPGSSRRLFLIRFAFFAE